MLQEVQRNTSGLDAGIGTVSADVQQVHDDLTLANGLPVRVQSQASDVDVSVPAGLEVTNQPDLAPVTQAGIDTRDTLHQNMWAILGLLVGFGALAVIYKLVRP